MKRRKIFMLCMMAAVMCLCLAACGNGNKDVSQSRYVGTWKAVSAEFNDEDIDLNETFNGDVILTLNADGTASLTGDGEEAAGTWEETSGGVRITGDMKVKLEEDDGRLEAEMLGFEITFEKQ